MLSALKIPFDATVQMQAVTFSLSDFYGTWLMVERRLKKLIDDSSSCTDFAKILLENITSRRASLLNTEGMFCAVYLDKRYAFKLKDDEKRIAKNALTKLHHNARGLRAENSPDSSLFVSEQLTDDEMDSFEAEARAEEMGNLPYMETNDVEKSFEESLLAYEDLPREFNKNNLLKSWEKLKNLQPELYELASIIHSIPPTQSTIERAFSILGYILSCRRTNLSSDLLEKILLINLNRDLVDEINERDLSRL